MSNKTEDFKAKFTQELDMLKNAPAPEKIERSPTGDEMDAVAEANLISEAAASEGRRIGRITQLTKALRRIQLGVFGVCAACEEEIDDRRLVANPLADRCIECQEMVERFAKTNVAVAE